MFIPANGIASEIDSQIDTLQNDISRTERASRKLFSKDSRLVPIPIPISNPTIGTGLALSLMYMHSPQSENPNEPTTVTGVAGMYTNTDSWAVGGLHDGYYRDDRIRFRVPVAYGEFNINFYGIGNDNPIKDEPIEYLALSTIVVPRLLFRLPWNNWFFGAEYRLLSIDTQFNVPDSIIDAPGIGERSQTAGIGLIGLYDSRNSNFWPSEGSWLEVTVLNNGSYVGGDFNYGKLITKWAQYFPLGDAITWVYRLDGQFVDGRAPFWDLSRIRLRGYAGGQLLDDVAVTTQTEVRWNVHNRWTVLGFNCLNLNSRHYNEADTSRFLIAVCKGT
jgi:hypothetical protein